MSLRAVFRCDGGAAIGAGHVGRCLPLARALAATGAQVTFAGRFGGVAAELLARAGVPAVSPQAAATEPPDVVVADGYGLDDRELAPLRNGAPVLVIAAAGPLEPPALALDYHLRESAAGDDAESRAGHAQVVLRGPAFAPIDPRYVAARRPRDGARWLVSLGGGSAGAGLIDSAVAAAAATGACELWVPAGPPAEAPGIAIRRDPAADGLHNAAAWADVAISGAGVTAYELACAGVPAALVQVADNQTPVVAGLGRAGTAVTTAAGTLERDIAALGDDAARRRMADAGPALVDGFGVFRVRDALLAHLRGEAPAEPLAQRPARAGDARLLHRWRDDPAVRAASRLQEPVLYADHVSWLERALAAPDRTLLVIEHAGEPVGTVRFDRTSDEAEISVTVAAEARGRGLGRRLIAEACELQLAAWPRLERIVAAVRRENRRSAAAFERAGFRLMASDDEADPLLTLILDRRRPPR